MNNQQSKKKSTVFWISIVAVLIIVLLILGLSVRPKFHKQDSEKNDVPVYTQGENEEATEDVEDVKDTPVSKESTKAESNEKDAEIEAEAVETEVAEQAMPVIEFPLTLDNGKLELESLFQFEGVNPDSGNEEGSDIASIVLKNISDTYLIEANVSIALADGTELNFIVTELPAGKSAMAFSVDNLAITVNAACVSTSCEATYDADASTDQEKVSIVVDGINITVTNTTGEELSEVVIYCRSPLGEEYFGGVTYQYTVNKLSAYESTTVEAVDCILGMAEVVRVEIN